MTITKIQSFREGLTNSQHLNDAESLLHEIGKMINTIQ
jgi:hypothetical protein